MFRREGRSKFNGDFTLQLPGTRERGMGLKSLKNLIKEMKKIRRAASSSFTDDEDLKHNIYKVLRWEFMFYVLWLLFIYFFLVTVLKNKTLIIIVA